MTCKHETDLTELLEDFLLFFYKVVKITWTCT